MNAPRITLTLLDGRNATQLEQVTSLVAQDASGQFGLLPGHGDLVTVLVPGLFRYRQDGRADWSYGASAGGMLSCTRAADLTQVRIVSRRCLLGDVPEALQQQLDALLRSERALHVSTREQVVQLEQAFYKRMQQWAQMSPMAQAGGGAP